MDEITDSLERALDRIEDFRAIHEGRLSTDDPEPVNCLQESVGIGEATRSLFVERLGESAGRDPDRPGEVLLGMIVGLLAAQYESDRRPTESSPS